MLVGSNHPTGQVFRVKLGQVTLGKDAWLKDCNTLPSQGDVAFPRKPHATVGVGDSSSFPLSEHQINNSMGW